MPKPRKIPPIDVKDYAQQGYVHFKPFPPQVAIEMHFCTAMMERDQALEAMTSLLKAGIATWGDSFHTDARTIIEGL